jgi:argininosuccinate lyase
VLTEARLIVPPSDYVIKYHGPAGLGEGKRQFREFVAVDLAHTTMRVKEHIISRPVGCAILGQLIRRREVHADDFPIDPRKESFLLQVESYLRKSIDEDFAGQMRRGRSCIDQGTTVRGLYDRDRLLDVMDRLNPLPAAFARQASRHVRAIMPGYTHM